MTDLGYADSQIKTKESLQKLVVGKGHKKEKYKPDYALIVDGRPRCIIDAKAPTEKLENWVEQCSGYCLALNRKYPSENPVHLFVLSNGIATNVYLWDSDIPVLSLSFEDFQWGNPKLEQLKALIGAATVKGAMAPVATPSTPDFQFIRPTPEWARNLFAVCHRAIWKAGYGKESAFMEFVKIMFVKLWADRGLRENPATKQILAHGNESVKLPQAAVIFSEDWIERREAEGVTSPVDSILFDLLRTEIEESIELRKKKRLFDHNERIELRADVVKDVVRRLQHYDMYGIDEDLNGRLFETFLSATMRGKDLGQFFTPRSVVKMMTRLADIQVSRNKQDMVIDACCGSAGFLIEVLTAMRNQIRNNASLSENEKRALLSRVYENCIYGIDFGKKPPLARIARINMYLHGDGGSRIYAADGLDKRLDASLEKDPETIQNLQELRDALGKPVLFDVALTNPPFSMTKEVKNDSDRKIMLDYAIAQKSPDSAQLRPSLRSSVMFIERYWDLLYPGGKLITVIDDTLLASKDFAYVRDFIRSKFLIRAIISLPGDTFRRSGSRVKTSVLLLEKKRDSHDAQPSCFAFYSERLGIDDLTPRASEEDIREAREKAARETEEIVAGYNAYLRGELGPSILKPKQLTDRLDLKSPSLDPMYGRLVKKWRDEGIAVKPLKECVQPFEDIIKPFEQPDKIFTLIKVSYDGQCEKEKEKKGKAVVPKTMFRVAAGQIVFSVIRATDGAIGIVPPELDNALVSDTSYRVFTCETPEDAAYLWAVLRSHELRADMQSPSTGSSRYNTPWPEVGEVLVPWSDSQSRQTIGQKLLSVWAQERQLSKERSEAMNQIKALGVESPESIRRWRASKAPK